jgi:hypothetical protein
MITTCANCLNEAIYAYQVTGSYSIKYCSRHIPKFLSTPKYTGRLVKMSDLKAPEVAPKSSKKKTSAPVVEEAPVEEAPVEEVVEEPTPEVTEAE